MATDYLYKVYPTEIQEDLIKGPSRASLLLKMNVVIGIVMLSVVLGTCFRSKGDRIDLVFIVFGAPIIGYLFYKRYKYEKLPYERDIKTEKLFAIDDAEKSTIQLNELLKKSKELSESIIPQYEAKIFTLMEHIRLDFSENAISPFWENIERISIEFGKLKEVVDQVYLYGEFYTGVLNYKKHNFPIPFPIKANITISQDFLDEYRLIIRKAQSKPAFATIWEIRRNTAVNIAGFKTLSEAIDNMSDAIVSSISNLKDSIKSEFHDLKNFQKEQLKSISFNQRMMNKTLEDIDSKLYYIQYDKKPNYPFQRPLSDL